jgi:hypothetical protein
MEGESIGITTRCDLMFPVRHKLEDGDMMPEGRVLETCVNLISHVSIFYHRKILSSPTEAD